MKRFIWLGFLLIFIQTIFAIGVYDDSQIAIPYVYYTNNLDPTINVTLENSQSPVLIDKASLKVNSNISTMQISEIVEQSFRKTFSFDLQGFGVEPFNVSDDVFFELDVLDNLGNPVELDPVSDEVRFFIEFDLEPPRVVVLEEGTDSNIRFKDERGNILNVLFSEPVTNIEVFISSQLVYSYSKEDIFISDFPKNLQIPLPQEFLTGENYDIFVEFEDLAGNPGNYSTKLFLKPLELKLVTRQDEPSLSYNYDISFKDLFNETIYTKDKSFDLVLETNAISTCYFSDSLLVFKELNDVAEKEEFQSVDGKRHTFRVGNTDITKKMFIACSKNSNPEDIVYLSEQLLLGKQLIDLEFYDVTPSINFVKPELFLSSSPFDIVASTSHRGRCFAKLNSGNEALLTTQDFNSHFIENVELENEGSHTLEVRCLDVLNDEVALTSQFTYDTNYGVKIIASSPEFTAEATPRVEVIMSESADCRYSDEPIAYDNETFQKLRSLTREDDGRTYHFTPSALSKGKNNLNFYCLYDDQIFQNKVQITYDPNGPQLSNLRFENNGFESLFLSSTDKIEYAVDVNSTIPVKNYTIEIVYGNDSQEYVKKSESGKLVDDFRGAQSFRISAQNIIGKKGNVLDTPIKFDGIPPTLTVQEQGNVLLLVCVDIESSCKKIYYGLTTSQDSCFPVIKYKGNETIDYGENTHICAKARDEVGNLAELFKEIGGEYLEVPNTTTTVERNQTSNETIIVAPDEPIEDAPTFDPFEFNSGEEESSFNPLIILALALLLIGVSGGGYYAYKKGYLDKELERLGIKKKKVAGESKDYYSNVSTHDQPKSKGGKRSTYDEHLAKLRRFLDDTIDKRGKVFDSFDDVSKGGVKGYEDTLLKKGKKKKGSKKQDFDEFYKGAKKLEKTKAGDSAEKDADAFEKYYATKKKAKKNK